MTTEIDRVSETTKFNETYLLKGDTELWIKNVPIAMETDVTKQDGAATM